jgi:hypothetical protein
MIQSPRAFTGIGILNGAHKITSLASLGDFVRNTHHSRPEVRNFLSIYTSLIARRVFGKDVLRFFDFPDKEPPLETTVLGVCHRKLFPDK